MKNVQLYRNLTLLFMILTILGAGYMYIFKSDNSLFVVIPCLLSAIFATLVGREKNKEKPVNK